MTINRAFKIIGCILAISLGSIACSQPKDSNSYATYNISYNNLLFDIAADQDNNLYTADEETIHVYDENGSNTGTIKADGRFITGLFEYDGVVYALDFFNNKLIKIVDNRIEGEESFEPGMHDIIKIRRVGNFLYLQGEENTSNTGHKNTLLVYDLGKESIHDVIDNVFSFTAYKGNDVLLYKKEGSEVYFEVYDPMDTAGGKAVPFHGDIWDMEYDKKNGIIYYGKGSGIYATKLDDIKNAKKVGAIKEGVGFAHAGNIRIALTDGYIFVLDKQQGLLSRIAKEGIALGELVFLTQNNNDNFDEAFQSAYNVLVTREWQPKYTNNRDKFILSLLSGESKYDIFELTSNMPYSFYIIKNEAFADLSVSQLISEEVDRMFPAIKESSMYRGKLFGLPVSSWAEVLFYNREVLKENSIEIGENIGWDRLSGLLDEAGGKINLAANRYRVRQLLIEKYVINYTNILDDDVDFNTPAFRETLKIMKKIENRITHATPIIDANALIRDTAFLIGTYTTSKLTAETNFISIPDIRPDENEKSPMTIKWYVVNPMSRNKELAMRYLEEHIKQDVIQHGSVQVLYENHQLYEGFNETRFDSINTVMKNSCVSYQFNIYTEVQGILEKYLNGEITEDSAAEQINAKVQMIIGE